MRLLVTAHILVAVAHAQPPAPLTILDVPYIAQSELLCGGAAAAMILRYWGERGIDASAFSSLVDRSAAGIPTTALVDDLQRRGWTTTVVSGNASLITRELDAGRPVLALIEERPRSYHYVVVVGESADAVVFHDPARAPYRVMRRDEFTRRWNATSRWMAVVTPNARTTSSTEPSNPAASSPTDVAKSSCDALVADGVARAQARDLAGAERALTSALGCPGPSAARELAGVRVLQRRWADASELARAALARDSHDAYAWQVLATSEFIQDQPEQALQAWNEVGQPRVDLVRVDGLVRTRFRVVERLIGVEAGRELTPSGLLRARRRLSELPAAASTRLTYSPVGSGQVELRANVVERPVIPRDALSLGAIGVSALAARSIAIAVASPTGGGEAATIEWRFWPGRPRVGFDLHAPSPVGDVWGVSTFTERQPFDSARIATARRTSVSLDVANWITSAARVTIRGGVDRWDSTRGSLGRVGGQLRLSSPGDRIDGSLDGDGWLGGDRFSSISARVRFRSSTDRIGFVLTGVAGAAFVTRRTPADLWLGGDVGSVKTTLLRAHPIVNSDGALKTSRLGREVVHASAEAQRWWSTSLSLLHVGGATFIDTAQTRQRLDGTTRGDVDIGTGARFAAAGLPGVLRVDVAHGLRDGRNAISVVYATD